jgi:aldehyde dehydrogenase (NAD+)
MSSHQLVFQDLFNRQRSYFTADATEWRVDQLDRLIRMLKENFERFSEASKCDFKTALSERVFEVAASIGSIEAIKAQLAGWMQPTEAPIPKFLAATGHKGMF